MMQPRTPLIHSSDGSRVRSEPSLGARSRREPFIRGRPAFTLLEMLTTVAALVIVLGLMVSLARHVREASAIQLTKRLLLSLDGLMSQYEAQYHALPQVAPALICDADLRRLQTLMGFKLPKVKDFLANLSDLPNTEANEQAIQKAAVENNRQILDLLRPEAGSSAGVVSGTPQAIFNRAVLRDAWGTPIVYMPSMHPAIGIAPQNRRFFFSAGPGRKFLTQEDNLYSYEETGHSE